MFITGSINDHRKVKVIPGGKKGTEKYNGHTSHILAMALSSDGKYLVGT